MKITSITSIKNMVILHKALVEIKNNKYAVKKIYEEVIKEHKKEKWTS